MNQSQKLICGLAIFALAGLGSTTSAVAATPTISVGGVALDKAQLSSGSLKAVVAAGADTESVTFVLDGAYLGKDTTAPYSWDLKATPGKHKLKVRIESAKDRGSETASFTVKSGSTVTPPSQQPTPSPSTPTPTDPTGVQLQVRTADELSKALAGAKPGDVISVAPGVYTGRFEASAVGTKTAPITLKAASGTVFTTGSFSKGYGLHVTGSYWKVSGLTVNKAAKGIVLDGSVGTVIDQVDVGNIGDEGVHFRKGSSAGVLSNSTIHDTGLGSPSYGEGVYIGSAKSNWSSIMGSSSTPDRSDEVTVKNNRISNTSAEGIDVKEGTTGGVITGNVFTNSGFSGENFGDSWIDVKGNGYSISGNSGNGTLLDAFQVHKALSGWGNDNRFSNNTVVAGVPGYQVSVQSGVSGTYVACQPTQALKGLSNITCQK